MLPADYEIPKHYQPQLTQNMERLLRQGGSVLAMCMSQGSYKGESAEVVKQFGKAGARVGNEDRYGDTPIRTTPRTSRWVYPTTIDTGDLFDKEDDIRSLIDPSAPILAGFRDDLGEALDDEVIKPAFFGAAKTGKNGADTETFPDNTYDVALTIGGTGGANTGMNVKKLLAARKLLRKAKVKIGSEPIYCGLTALAESELFADPLYINGDYGEAVLDNGKLKSFLNFTFVSYENCPLTGDIRSLPVWAHSGMHLGTWLDVKTELGRDPAKKFNVRAYITQIKGCTRTQLGKVIRVYCADTEH